MLTHGFFQGWGIGIVEGNQYRSIKNSARKHAVGPSGKFLLALASTVILDSESCGTHAPLLLSHDSESRATLTRLEFLKPPKYKVHGSQLNTQNHM
jgi:hypothetical protein